jgi:Family of unknown function (DUF6178)
MLKHGTHQRLLQRLLDQPALARRIRALAPEHLGQLIRDVGLDDAGEIVALATTEQLVAVFDEDVWASKQPGEDEQFDSGRFVLWLEVMLEAGSPFVARAVTGLPEAMIVHALDQLTVVLDFDALRTDLQGDDAEAARIDEALDASQYLEIDEYMIVWRGRDGWEALVALLTELDQSHRPFLERVLNACCAATSERSSDDDGLYQALTEAQMRAGDASGERAERRAKRGYLSPSDATSFLRIARVTELSDLVRAGRDPVVRAFFRELDQTPVVVAPPSADEAIAALPAGPASEGPRHPLREALVSLSQSNPSRFAERLEELAFLVNVVVAGCRLEDRQLRATEAADIVLGLCEVGLEHLLITEVDSVQRAVEDHGVDKLFRIGWHLLGAWPDDVIWSAVPPSTGRMLRSLVTA